MTHKNFQFNVNIQPMILYSGCSNAYSSGNKLRYHINKIHKRNYVCTITGCVRSFGRNTDLKGHLKVHTMGKAYM